MRQSTWKGFGDVWRSAEFSMQGHTLTLSRDILPDMASIQRLKEHFQWHILAVLVNEYFPKFRSELGEPPSDFKLQLEKMSCSTAKAMYAKASTTDGNIEALNSLLEQSGIGDAEVFRKYVVLVHGDLGTLEKLIPSCDHSTLRRVYRNRCATSFLCQVY